MGSLFSSTDEETPPHTSGEEKRGFVVNKSDSGEVRITRGFVDQLKDNEQLVGGENYFARERELENRVHHLMAAAKREGMEEVMRNSEEKIASLSSALEKEKEANEKFKNVTYPMLDNSARAVVTKLTSDNAGLVLNKKQLVCADLMEKITKCYHNNPHKTLYCSEEVRQFIDCAKTARSNLTHKSNSRSGVK